MIRLRAGRRFFPPQIRIFVLHRPILISSALTPGSSTRTMIIFSVSQTSTGGAHAPDTNGFSVSVASCKAAKRRPTRSPSLCNSSRSNPVARIGLIITVGRRSAALLSPCCARIPRADQVFKLSHELRHVFKLQIHGSETNICDLVEFFQAPHDHLANLTRRTFTFRRFLNILFDCIYDTVELCRWYRALFTSAQQSRHYFVAVESLAPAVFFYDHVRYLVDALVRRKSSLTTKTFSPAANCIAFTGLARVDNFVFEITAERTFHLIEPRQQGSQNLCWTPVFLNVKCSNLHGQHRKRQTGRLDQNPPGAERSRRPPPSPFQLPGIKTRQQ